jgi:hypothetical protein
MLLTWADGPVSQQSIDLLAARQSQQLVLHFTPIDRGAIVKVA